MRFTSGWPARRRRTLSATLAAAGDPGAGGDARPRSGRAGRDVFGDRFRTGPGEHPRQRLAVESTELAELSAQAHDGRPILGLHVLTSPVDRTGKRVEAVSDDCVEAPVVEHLANAFGSRPERRTKPLARLLLDWKLRNQGNWGHIQRRQSTEGSVHRQAMRIATARLAPVDPGRRSCFRLVERRHVLTAG